VEGHLLPRRREVEDANAVLRRPLHPGLGHLEHGDAGSAFHIDFHRRRGRIRLTHAGLPPLGVSASVAVSVADRFVPAVSDGQLSAATTMKDKKNSATAPMVMRTVSTNTFMKLCERASTPRARSSSTHH